MKSWTELAVRNKMESLPPLIEMPWKNCNKRIAKVAIFGNLCPFCTGRFHPWFNRRSELAPVWPFLNQTFLELSFLFKIFHVSFTTSPLHCAALHSITTPMIAALMIAALMIAAPMIAAPIISAHMIAAPMIAAPMITIPTIAAPFCRFQSNHFQLAAPFSSTPKFTQPDINVLICHAFYSIFAVPFR